MGSDWETERMGIPGGMSGVHRSIKVRKREAVSRRPWLEGAGVGK